jgi:superoxide dismutase
MPYELPPLPYDYDALEHDRRAHDQIHHGKHPCTTSTT